jgi:hypothetical protein
VESGNNLWLADEFTRELGNDSCHCWAHFCTFNLHKRASGDKDMVNIFSTASEHSRFLYQVANIVSNDP